MLTMATTNENMINPLHLNRDCWLLICDLLTCREILNLAKVSDVYRKCMQAYVLPTKFKKLDISFKFNYNCIDEEDFRIVLDSIWPTVESVHLLYLSEKQFELLKLYRFPCASEMRVSLARTMNDTDTRALCEVFPNLRIFTPHGICSSQTIISFRHLENLTLTGCRNINMDDIRQILLALNLKSLALDIFKKVTPLNHVEQLELCKLEEITLNCYELSWLSSYDAFNPFTFTNLNVLIVTGGLTENENIDNLFRNMKCIVPRVVYELELVNVGIEFLRKFMMPEKYGFLNDIQKLKCINIDILMDVFGVPSKFKGLRELYFYYCHTTSHQVAQAIVSNFEELDLLSFEECQMPFIDESCFKAVKARKKQLTFNWHPYDKSLPAFCADYYKGLIRFKRQSYISSNFDSMTMKFK